MGASFQLQYLFFHCRKFPNQYFSVSGHQFVTIIICKLKLVFSFISFRQRIMKCKYFPFPTGRVWILRKRIDILVVSDSISKGNEPLRFTVKRRNRLEERDSVCEGSLNREEWLSFPLPILGSQEVRKW